MRLSLPDAPLLRRSSIALTVTDFTAQQLARLKKQFERFFAFSPLRRHLSSLVQLQLIKSSMTGATLYLSGVILRTEAELDPLDAVVREAARALLGGLPDVATNALVIAHTGIPFAFATQARARERAFYSAEHSDPPTIFADLLSELEGGEKASQNFVNRRRRLCKTERERYGVQVPCSPERAGDVHGEAARYGLAVNLGMFQFLLRSVRPQPFLTRPRPAPPLASVLDALSGAPIGPSDVRVPPPGQHFPASFVGAGTLGSLALIADAPAHRVALVVANAAGTVAMSLHPWANRRGVHAQGVVEPARPDDEPAPGSAAAQRRAHRPARAAADRPCAVCRRDSDDPYHCFFICRAAHLAVARLSMQAELPDVMRELVNAVPIAAASALRDVHGAGLDGLPGADWDAPEGRAIAFRILCALQFPAKAVGLEEAAPCARALGAIFDSMTSAPGSWRRAARVVLGFAAAHTERVAAARQAALLDIGEVEGPTPPDAPGFMGLFRFGATISAASHPVETYLRWRKPRNSVCDECGTGGGTLISCAQCDTVRHGAGDASACTSRVLPALDADEWVCRSCALVLTPLTVALGDAAPHAIEARRR